eukprot:GHVR01058204.1.p1 GENE.GHVR01058204.1~~GHVR01058204.1.p1  ORF type:complete len:650 (+),score=141.48 GHVR01058204.1:29-1978(+)
MQTPVVVKQIKSLEDAHRNDYHFAQKMLEVCSKSKEQRHASDMKYLKLDWIETAQSLSKESSTLQDQLDSLELHLQITSFEPIDSLCSKVSMCNVNKGSKELTQEWCNQHVSEFDDALAYHIKSTKAKTNLFSLLLTKSKVLSNQQPPPPAVVLSARQKELHEAALSAERSVCECQEYLQKIETKLTLEAEAATESARHAMDKVKEDEEILKLMRGSTTRYNNSYHNGEKEDENLTEEETEMLTKEPNTIEHSTILSVYWSSLREHTLTFTPKLRSTTSLFSQLRSEQHCPQTDQHTTIDKGFRWSSSDRLKFDSLWHHFNPATALNKSSTLRLSKARGCKGGSRGLFWQRLTLELPHVPKDHMERRDKLHFDVRKLSLRKKILVKSFRQLRLKLLGAVKAKLQKVETQEIERKDNNIIKMQQDGKVHILHSRLKSLRETRRHRDRENDRVKNIERHKREMILCTAKSLEAKRRGHQRIKLEAFRKQKEIDAEEADVAKREERNLYELKKHSLSSLNSMRLDMRKILDEFRREEAALKRRETQMESVARLERIQRAVAKFRVTVSRDPQRITQPTASYTNAVEAERDVCVSMNSFTSTDLNKDMRYKLAQELLNAGLLNTQAGRMALLSAPPVKEPRKDLKTSPLNPFN